MALSGLEIYKLLPQTNCKDCGYPTCLAFAMKLAAKQAELKDCPHVGDEAKTKLAAAAAPPIRLVEVHGGNGVVKAGNETVLFRHEKTFYNKPGIFLQLRVGDGLEKIKSTVETADSYKVDYVGIDLELDGFALEAGEASEAEFVEAINAVTALSSKPLMLSSTNPSYLKAGMAQLDGARPLLYAADQDNLAVMGELAKEADVPLVVKADSLETLEQLCQQLIDMGLKDLVLDPGVEGYHDSLETLTALRRLALKKNLRTLGFPIMTFPGRAGPEHEAMLAAQHIAKYAGFIVLSEFDQAELYALLVLRQNIYTDPQKPIQVQPGVYEINNPDKSSPLMVTTNFSITYFSVANEVEGSGWPGWLLVAEAEGMSVLTAWAAGKFDADVIAKAVKQFDLENKVEHRKIILPGQVAVLSGELEEELPGWEIMVGPREAVDIASYLKAMWVEA